MAGATVIGTTLNDAGSPVAAVLSFSREIAGANTMTVRNRVRRASRPDGAFAVYLDSGTYWVEIGRSGQMFRIAVPGDERTHNLSSLLVLPDGSPFGGGSIPRATDSVVGGVKTNSYSADPIVYLKTEVDSLFGVVEHVQSSPVSTLDFSHNLGRKPDVRITVSEVVTFAEVEHLDTNTVRLTFGQPTSFTARFQ